MAWPAMTVFAGAAAAALCLLIAGQAIVGHRGFPSRAPEDILAGINGLEAPDKSGSKYCRHVSLDGLNGGEACEIGKSPNGRYEFVLWGDSHAQHFLPAIATLAGSRSVPGLLVHRGACRPFLDEPHTSKACREFNASVGDWLRNNPVKLVILAGRWRNYIKLIRGFTTDTRPEHNSGGLAKTLAFLNGQNIEVTVLDQTPDFPIDVRLCVARALFFGRSSESCVTEPVSRFTSWHQDIEKYFNFLSTQYRFTVASGEKAICGRDFCRARADGTLLMTDENHLSEAGALRTAPYLNIPLFAAPPSEVLAEGDMAPSGGNAPPL
jgi:hypothetical protein